MIVPSKRKRSTELTAEITATIGVAIETEIAVYNEIQEAKLRLLNRVQRAIHDTDHPLREKFGLCWKNPSSAAELIEAIQQKKFVAPAPDDKSARYHEWFGIEFRDPKIVKDEEGYKTARKKIQEAAEKVGDEIFVLSPAEGLESFRKFESFVEKLMK
jgi:hypothetical protein